MFPLRSGVKQFSKIVIGMYSFVLISFYDGDHSYSTYAKFSGKLTLLTPLIRTRMYCVNIAYFYPLILHICWFTMRSFKRIHFWTYVILTINDMPQALDFDLFLYADKRKQKKRKVLE